MVKNYIISAVRPIKSGWHLESNRDLYKNYLEMHKMSLASYKKFSSYEFESILLTAPVSNNDNYTIANWYTIKDLWHREPCNILWAGADTIMMKPTDIFGGEFTDYRLFNYTDPKSFNNEITHYFNDDVQYFPHTMRKEVWEVGELWMDYREAHPHRQWGFDQIRHNKMMWSQGIDIEKARRPDLAWQAFAVRDLDNRQSVQWQSDWNGLDAEKAHIIHFHASRGSEQVINVMKTICERLEITI